MLNRFELIGRLGRDPDVRYSQSGTAIVNVSMAVSEKYKDKETTEWFPLVVFGRQAEIFGEYLSKGSLVYVSGRMQMNEWEDRNSGEKKSKLDFVVQDMKMLPSGGGKQNNQQQSQNNNQQNTQYQQNKQRQQPQNKVDDSDIPF